MDTFGSALLPFVLYVSGPIMIVCGVLEIIYALYTDRLGMMITVSRIFFIRIDRDNSDNAYLSRHVDSLCTLQREWSI